MSNFNSAGVRNGIAVLLLLGVAGCNDGDGQDPQETDPLAGAPKVGTCHQLTDVDIYGVSTDAATVPCDSDHNSYTYHVGRLANEAGETPGTFARRKCRALLPDALGLPADKVLSTVFDVAAFQPPVSQEAAGAAWYRCELVAHSEEWAFKALPPGRPPYFAGGVVPDTYLACADASRDKGVRVSCDMPHTHKWNGSFAGPKERPTRDGLVRLAEQRCPAIANTRYWYTSWPMQRDWDAGFRVINCYA